MVRRKGRYVNDTKDEGPPNKAARPKAGWVGIHPPYGLVTR
jgi:hypothetical protein